MSECVFCAIAQGQAPARILREWDDAIALLTTSPYAEGHALVIPRTHVRDAAQNPALTGAIMTRAAQLAADTMTAANILTSWGAPATQTVWHLHLHVVPRVEGDRTHMGLWPWPRRVQLLSPLPPDHVDRPAGAPTTPLASDNRAR